MTMEFETKTGIGYHVDASGKVVDYYDVPPGKHKAGGSRENAIDVDSVADLPKIADKHLPDIVNG